MVLRGVPSLLDLPVSCLTEAVSVGEPGTDLGLVVDHVRVLSVEPVNAGNIHVLAENDRLLCYYDFKLRDCSAFIDSPKLPIEIVDQFSEMLR